MTDKEINRILKETIEDKNEIIDLLRERVEWLEHKDRINVKYANMRNSTRRE